MRGFWTTCWACYASIVEVTSQLSATTRRGSTDAPYPLVDWKSGPACLCLRHEPRLYANGVPQ